MGSIHFNKELKMKKVEITKNTGLRNNKRVAYVCGDYVCITRFETVRNQPLTGKNVHIVVSKESDWESANPYSLLVEFVDNDLPRIKTLKQFEEFASA